MQYCYKVRHLYHFWSSQESAGGIPDRLVPYTCTLFARRCTNLEPIFAAAASGKISTFACPATALSLFTFFLSDSRILLLHLPGILRQFSDPVSAAVPVLLASRTFFTGSLSPPDPSVENDRKAHFASVPVNVSNVSQEEIAIPACCSTVG